MKFLTAVFCLLASGTFADTPMTGAEFDEYTRGKTLTYMDGGQAYGIEEYRPGRQVKWAFDGNECQDGHWWEPETGLICFAYDNAPDNPQCWNFTISDNGLHAEFKGESEGPQLYEARNSKQPLICLGPEVGV